MEPVCRYSTEKHPYYEVRCDYVDLNKLETGRSIKGWFIYEEHVSKFKLDFPGYLCMLVCCCLPCIIGCSDEEVPGFQVPDFDGYRPPSYQPSAPTIPVAVPVYTK